MPTVRGTPIGGVSIIVAIVASMGGFLFGYDTGQISGLIEMPDFTQRFATGELDPATGLRAWNSWLQGLVVSFLSLGTMIGVILGAPMADRLGRRRAMSAECIIFTVGVIIQVVSFDAWYQVAIGRLVTGVGVGALSAAVPLYQSETVPRQIRGALVATYQLFITFGILVAYCINIGTREINNSAQWRIPVALGIVFAAILGIGIQFCPESPRWLAKQGRNDEAYRAVNIVRGYRKGTSNPWSEAEYAEILAAVEEESRIPKASWVDCFKPARKTLYRTLLGIYLQAGQQLTGANYFFYYGVTIFRSTGLDDSFVTQIILGAVNFGCTFLGLYILERFGRRLPLIYGAAWMVVWLLVFGLAGTLGQPETNRNIGILMIVSTCLFILGYATTWAPGIWLFVGETFAGHTRAKQASLATLSNWTWNFLIGYFSPAIAGNIAYRYGFVFAGANFLNTIVAFFFVYETQSLTLEAIDEMYNDPKCKPWQSTKWVPAGYASRNDVVKEAGADDATLNAEDPQKGRWRSKPDPVTGEEKDLARKKPEQPTVSDASTSSSA